MEIIGKDCRDICEVIHTSLSLEKRRAIEAARTRAGEIADLWLDYHFFGVKWNRDSFGYLRRESGKDWFTAHYDAKAPWKKRSNGSRYPEFSKTGFRRQLRDFIVHGVKNTEPVWRYRGNPVVGLGFPISDNKRQRRVLSIDVDYSAIKRLQHGWACRNPRAGLARPAREAQPAADG